MGPRIGSKIAEIVGVHSPLGRGSSALIWQSTVVCSIYD